MRRFSFPCDPVDTVDGEYINSLHYDVLLTDVTRLVVAAKLAHAYDMSEESYKKLGEAIAAVEARMGEVE